MTSERITGLRSSRNMTRRELAEKCGLTERALSNYERGLRLPDAEALIKLSRGLNVSTDYLLGLTDSTKRIEAKELDNEHSTTANLLAARVFDLAKLDQDAGYDRNCLPVYALILDGLINLSADINMLYKEQCEQNAVFSISGIKDCILSAEAMQELREQQRAFEDAVLKMTAGAGIIIDRVISSQLAARMIGQDVADKSLIDRSDQIIAHEFENIVRRSQK